jgi:hypothetical protein
MNDAKISYAFKESEVGKKYLYPENVELQKQMRDLQNMYPEYYSNWLKEHEMRERKSRTNVVQ